MHLCECLFHRIYSPLTAVDMFWSVESRGSDAVRGGGTGAWQAPKVCPPPPHLKHSQLLYHVVVFCAQGAHSWPDCISARLWPGTPPLVGLLR